MHLKIEDNGYNFDHSTLEIELREDGYVSYFLPQIPLDFDPETGEPISLTIIEEIFHEKLFRQAIFAPGPQMMDIAFGYNKRDRKTGKFIGSIEIGCSKHINKN